MNFVNSTYENDFLSYSETNSINNNNNNNDDDEELDLDLKLIFIFVALALKTLLIFFLLRTKCFERSQYFKTRARTRGYNARLRQRRLLESWDAEAAGVDGRAPTSVSANTDAHPAPIRPLLIPLSATLPDVILPTMPQPPPPCHFEDLPPAYDDALTMDGVEEATGRNPWLAETFEDAIGQFGSENHDDGVGKDPPGWLEEEVGRRMSRGMVDGEEMREAKDDEDDEEDEVSEEDQLPEYDDVFRQTEEGLWATADEPLR